MIQQKQEVATANYTVYQHICPNGKSYFGITRVDPEKRWANGHGYASNEYFQNAINKYGWKNITHKIIKTSLTKEEAMQMERDLIARYKTNSRDHGYNITSGGECTGKHSEETKQKISENRIGKGSRKGYHHTEEAKKKMSESHKGMRYNTGNPFTEERKMHLRKPHPSMLGEGNPMYGRKWTAEEIAVRQSHRIYKTGGENPTAKKIVQYLDDGTVIKVWGSLSEASKVFCRTSLKDCLKGKYKHHKGYKWKYLEGDEKCL